MASIYGADTWGTGDSSTKKADRAWKLRLDYSYTQNIEKNTSTVTMTLYIYDGTGYSKNVDADSCYYTLYDSQKVYHPYQYDKTGWYELSTKTVTVPHNADGTKTVTLSATWDCGFTSSWTPRTLSLSANVTLATIPRASTMTVPAAMTMGVAATLTVSRASTAFTHAIRYSFGSDSGTAATGIGASTAWTPPISLAAQIPNALSGTVTLTLDTYSGGTLIGSRSYTSALYVPDYKPVTQMSVSLVNDNDVITEWGVAVKGYTKVQYALSGTTQYGATVNRWRFTACGETLSTSSGTTSALTESGEITVSGQIGDGRKWSDTVSQTVHVYEYGLPSILNGHAYRCASDGTASDEGTFLHVLCDGTAYSVGGHNAMTCRARYRRVGGAWGGYTTLTNGVAAVLQAEMAVNYSYEVEISVTDALGSSRTVVYQIPTAAVAFNLRSGGAGAAFGKYAERDRALELPAGWDYYRGGERLIDVIYPVGCVFTAATGSSLNPETLFGGTWAEVTVSGLQAWKRTD